RAAPSTAPARRYIPAFTFGSLTSRSRRGSMGVTRSFDERGERRGNAPLRQALHLAPPDWTGTPPRSGPQRARCPSRTTTVTEESTPTATTAAASAASPASSSAASASASPVGGGGGGSGGFSAAAAAAAAASSSPSSSATVLAP
ncbi:unnamed protein product, partial [Ectocarpus sp. 8 AP-2014]